jgi:hypothetical protein
LCREAGPKAIYYDAQNEVPPGVSYHSYTPRNAYDVNELERCLKTWIDGGLYRLIVVDELNRYAPSKPATLPHQLARLNDDCRHKNISFIGIARRPCQVNQDLTELADELNIFFLRGRNDLKYLDDICDGLAARVKALPAYNYIQYTGREIKQCAPVFVDNAWQKRETRHKQTVVKGR